MVKFSQKLSSNRVAKWESHYIDYEKLKKMLKNYSDFNDSDAIKMKKINVNNIVAASETTALLSANKGDNDKLCDSKIFEEFQQTLRNECLKIDEFYLKKLKECELHLGNLAKYASKNISVNEGDKISNLLIESASIKRAYSEIFRTMNLLQAFTILNYTGLIKIIKKHNKVSQHFKINLEKVLPLPPEFLNAYKLSQLIEKVEEIVAASFYHGNRILARNELLIEHLPVSKWRLILTGLHLGIIIILFLWVIWSIMTISWATGKVEENTQSFLLISVPTEILRVYRSLGIILFCFWAWTVDVYLWRYNRVNYVYLFEFDPRTVHSLESLILISSRLTILYFLNILFYFKVSRDEISFIAPVYANYAPMFILILFMYLFAVSGAHQLLLQVIFAPFVELTFVNSFVADVLTSLVRPIVDMSYTFCFYLSGEWQKYAKTSFASKTSCDESFTFNRLIIPCIITLPLLFRFLQCIRRYYDTSKRHPNLSNALKYSVAYILVLLGAIHPSLSTYNSKSNFRVLWATVFALSTTYTFFWDIKVDWGLGNLRYGFLREKRMFSNKSLYYVALFLDVFLRFSWCLTLIPDIDQLGLRGEGFIFVIGLLEVFRRAYWTLLRVEYEHLFNTSGYRRVDFIPLHFESVAKKNKSQTVNYKPKTEVIVELLVFVVVVVGFAILTLINEFISGDVD